MFSKTLEPNPLNLFDCRKTNTCPDFFETVNMPFRYNLQDAVEKWVVEHLKGRYFIGRNFTINENTNDIDKTIMIGFEDPKEASYFILACPFLKYK